MKLPVEIELRHVEQNLAATIGPDERVLDVLAAQVHVRREGVKRDRFFDRHLARDLPVVYVRRDVGNPPAHLHLFAVNDASLAKLLSADVDRIGNAFREDFVNDGLLGEPES